MLVFIDCNSEDVIDESRMMRMDQWELLSPFSDDPSFNFSHLLDTWRHLVELRVFSFLFLFLVVVFPPSFQRVLVLLYLLLNKCSGCSVFVDVYMCFTSILLFMCESYSYVLEVTVLGKNDKVLLLLLHWFGLM